MFGKPRWLGYFLLIGRESNGYADITLMHRNLRTTRDRQRTPIRGATLAACVALFLAGCDQPQIAVYEIPKEQAFAAATPSTRETSDRPHVHFDKVPSGWTEKPASGMRVANFSLGAGERTAEVTIIPLSGAFGTELSNLNRWRNELGLAPINEEEAARAAAPVSIAGQTGKLFDLVSDTPNLADKFKERTTAAMVQTGDTMWFVKMRGEDELVASQKGAFIEFLSGVSFHTTADDEPAVAQAPANPGAPAWTLPAGWKEVPATTMLLAKFTAGSAEVTVSKFPGDVGGLVANVNRWRRQIGLTDAGEAEIAQQISVLELNGGKATLVDVAGAKGRIVGVIVPRGGETWFYKLMGDADTVGAEKAKFLSFVQTMRYPNG
ncbi:MAG: hypothetical protein AB1705_16725 [Verrucomicrobiota bacterium]